MSALLLVFSEPGPELTEEEFHNWYEGEHIPLRVPLTGILNATRLTATDGNKPSWGAIYDIDSLDTFRTPEYQRLASTRSEREKNVIARLAPLDRRNYKLIGARSSDTFDPQKERASVYVFNSMTPSLASEEEFNKWYDEEHLGLLSKVPGWLRTRRYELTDHGGTSQPPPKFLAIHEYSDPKGLESDEFKAAIDTPWRTKVMETIESKERRVFKVWKTFK